MASKHRVSKLEGLAGTGPRCLCPRLIVFVGEGEPWSQLPASCPACRLPVKPSPDDPPSIIEIGTAAPRED
jgi:hypothetical protein